MSEMEWHKSSRCSGDANCVEVAADVEAVHLRDSTTPDAPHLHFSRDQFCDLLDKIREL